MRRCQFAHAHIGFDFDFPVKRLFIRALLVSGELFGKFVAPVFREDIPGDVAFFHLRVHADFHDGAVADEGEEAGIGEWFQAGKGVGVAAFGLRVLGHLEGLQLDGQFVGEPDFLIIQRFGVRRQHDFEFARHVGNRRPLKEQRKDDHGADDVEDEARFRHPGH